MYLFIKVPASTPNNEEQISAEAEPIKTAVLDFDSDANIIVVIWVLSPSSAKKTRKNVENIILSIKTPPNYLIKIFITVEYILIIKIKYTLEA